MSESVGIVEFKVLYDKLKGLGEIDGAGRDILMTKFNMLSMDEKIVIIERAFSEVVCETMDEVEREAALHEVRTMLDLKAWFVKSALVLMTISMIGFLVIQVVYNEESGFMTATEAFAAIYGVVNELLLGGTK